MEKKGKQKGSKGKQRGKGGNKEDQDVTKANKREKR